MKPILRDSATLMKPILRDMGRGTVSWIRWILPSPSNSLNPPYLDHYFKGLGLETHLLILGVARNPSFYLI